MQSGCTLWAWLPETYPHLYQCSTVLWHWPPWLLALSGSCSSFFHLLHLMIEQQQQQQKRVYPWLHTSVSPLDVAHPYPNSQPGPLSCGHSGSTSLCQPIPHSRDPAGHKWHIPCRPEPEPISKRQFYLSFLCCNPISIWFQTMDWLAQPTWSLGWPLRALALVIFVIPRVVWGPWLHSLFLHHRCHCKVKSHINTGEMLLPLQSGHMPGKGVV